MDNNMFALIAVVVIAVLAGADKVINHRSNKLLIDAAHSLATDVIPVQTAKDIMATVSTLAALAKSMAPDQVDAAIDMATDTMKSVLETSVPTITVPPVESIPDEPPKLLRGQPDTDTFQAEGNQV